MNLTTDRNGSIVQVGTKVRVLEVSPSLLSQLDDEEKPYVKSMLGEVFTVYEIDEHGFAWVEKWWHATPKDSFSHSLGLSPAEMEVDTK